MPGIIKNYRFAKWQGNEWGAVERMAPYEPAPFASYSQGQTRLKCDKCNTSFRTTKKKLAAECPFCFAKVEIEK